MGGRGTAGVLCHLSTCIANGRTNIAAAPVMKQQDWFFGTKGGYSGDIAHRAAK
jgi:hypothetical protein